MGRIARLRRMYGCSTDVWNSVCNIHSAAATLTADANLGPHAEPDEAPAARKTAGQSPFRLIFVQN